MNAHKILAVADAIESAAFNDLGFNMVTMLAPQCTVRPDMSGKHCGTVACIAGWTVMLARSVWPDDEDNYRDSICKQNGGYRPPMNDMAFARYVLGLSEEMGNDLFVPFNYDDNSIHAKQAVRTLRHLAFTGEIDFKIGVVGFNVKDSPELI